MSFKDTWRPRVDGVDDADSSAVNEIAEGLIELEKNGIGKETDPTVPDWAKQPNKPTYTSGEVGAYTKDEVANLLNGFYFKAEVDTMFADYYTKTEVDGIVGDICKDATVSFFDVETLTVEDNTTYIAQEEISSLFIFYPDTDFICSFQFTLASEGDITITLPESKYIGGVPEFANGETWELNIKNGVVVGGKVE